MSESPTTRRSLRRSTPRSSLRRGRRIPAITLIGALTVTSLTTGAGVAQATDAHTPAVMVAKMTGRDSVSATDTKWGITGTDLGISWDNGSGQILTLFGDTFGKWTGPGGGGDDWRSNVLLRSDDKDLSDGVSYVSAPQDRAGHAKELIPSKKTEGVEVTTIPTAAISVGHRQYMAFMSVKHWGPPGEWDTSFSKFAYSDDNGETWLTKNTPQWTNNAAGTDGFQMAAFVKSGGYVYMYGTPNGRFGPARVARVPQAKMLTQSAWRYWDGKRWGSNEPKAAAVVPANVSELSVQYNDYTHSFQMMYLQDSDVVLRQSKSPEGPWSTPQAVVSSDDYPGLYGGFMDPRSSGPNLYFALSQWDPYNTFLMRITLDRSGKVVNPNLIGDEGWERQRTSAVADPWKCFGNCGTDANYTWAYSGDHNGWVRNDHGWNAQQQNVRVQPNTDYLFTGWIKTSANSDNGYIGVRTPSQQILSERNFKSIANWTRYQIPFNSGDRTSIQVYAGIWTDNGDMWLQTDNFSIVTADEPTPPADGVSLTVSAASQCQKRNAALQVRATNNTQDRVDVTIVTPLGSATAKKVKPGDIVADQFDPKRDRHNLAAGSVTVTGSVQWHGRTISQSYQLAYDEVNC